MSKATDPIFLPGVPEARIRKIFAAAAGNEIESGKFVSPQSSAALAANGFGWFLDKPQLLPLFPSLSDLSGEVEAVQIEREIRFPWSGGRHPWLDAVVHIPGYTIGVESKRFEPFRDQKRAVFSDAYDRGVWGVQMRRWCQMRDALRIEPKRYKHLDAAQLVKHAFALSAEATRAQVETVLVYLYAEPKGADGPSKAQCELHKTEVEDFAARVAGDRVRFAACTWLSWLAIFEGQAAAHAKRVIEVFRP